MTTRSVSVVIAARNPVLCGLQTILRAEGDFNVVASCRDGASCIEAIRDLSPNLTLLDVSLPGQGGFHVLAAIKSEHLRTQVVFLSASDTEQPTARHAYNPNKEAARHLLSFLRQLASEPRPLPIPPSQNRRGHGPRSAREEPSTALTARERQIMDLVCGGQSNKEVGRRLNLSEGTVKVHLHHIYQKLAIHNRTTLAALAAHFGDESFPAEGQRISELPLAAIARISDSNGGQPIGPTHPITAGGRKSRAVAKLPE